MFRWLILLLIVPATVQADIFALAPDQDAWRQAIRQDSRGHYYQGRLDYNAFAPAEKKDMLERKSIPVGYDRYDLNDNLLKILNRESLENFEVDQTMRHLERSPLLTWQYSSPTLADLYKHSETMAYLRLNLRFKQYIDLESTLNDPITRLRKQALLDCIRRIKNIDGGDIDLAFEKCYEDSEKDNFSSPFSSLEDPGNGQSNINGTVNVTKETLERVTEKNEDLTTTLEILPNIKISDDSVRIDLPKWQSRELIHLYREEYVANFKEIISNYPRTPNEENLASLSVFGVPMTEAQIRNLYTLKERDQYIAVSKIASNLSYLKMIDQYQHALDMLERVLTHPAIQPGYKTFIKSSVNYVQSQILSLKEEKERLSQYLQEMGDVVRQADQVRLDTTRLLKQESQRKEKQLLWNLSP